jgi:signal transduction histidine kinase
MTNRRMPHTVPSMAASETLQRLTEFARDMGTISALPAAAERILGEFSAVIRYQHGALYIIDRERDRYRRLAAIGPRFAGQSHATMPTRHPLASQIAAEGGPFRPKPDAERTTTGRAAGDSFDPSGDLPVDLAVPLRNRGRLVAFGLFQATPDAAAIDHDRMEHLLVPAQIAANALDAILVRDDLHQSQTLMRRTDRLRSLEIIAGGFAHEIRNPLTSIKTFIQLAPERKNDMEFIRDFSRIVLDDVLRIERLIQEILDYARYMEPKLTEEDLNELVASCLYFIEVKADSRGIKIQKELAPGLPRVMLDRQQIKQVLLNLLLNAMDAMGERGGSLRVQTRPTTAPDGTLWVQTEIEDTGHGISAANLEHIFDPFFTTKHACEEREGTGLGLTIAYQIVQEHLGTLRVKSTEGVGTTFFVNLPAHS